MVIGKRPPCQASMNPCSDAKMKNAGAPPTIAGPVVTKSDAAKPAIPAAGAKPAPTPTGTATRLANAKLRIDR